MKRCIPFLLMAIAATRAAEVRFTGTLYSNRSGPSASGTGEIVLAVGAHMYRFDYQKPFPKRFSDPTCQIAGSIWSVEAVLSNDHEGRVLRATCVGRRDAVAYPAVTLVSKWLNLIADRRFMEAYGLFVQEYRDHQPFADFESEIKHLDLRLYQTHRQSQCLEIVNKLVTVTIIAGLDCMIERDQSGTSTIQFEIVPQTTKHPSGIAGTSWR
jgi:hypothetical protein